MPQVPAFKRTYIPHTTLRCIALLAAAALVVSLSLPGRAAARYEFVEQWQANAGIFGLALSTSGRELFVVQGDDGTVYDYRTDVTDPSQRLITSFRPCAYDNPWGARGIARDSRGALYITYWLSNFVCRVEMPYREETASAIARGQVSYSRAVASDGDSIYLTNNSRSVDKFTSDGLLLNRWSQADGLPFVGAYGVALDAVGNLYVGESWSNYRIVKFGPDGSFIKQWGSYGNGDGQFQDISSIAIGPASGRVYVVDSDRKDIQVFDSDGQFIDKFGQPGSLGEGEFVKPMGIAVDSSENVYVSDWASGLIQKFRPASDPDPDTDGDGVPDSDDNCPDVANPGQEDLDQDALGNACDPDDDDDDVADQQDNCVSVHNPNQANLDGDLLGDACDSDDDNDGTLDGSDNCPFTYNDDQADLDADGAGDFCDPDDDNDRIGDGADNCPRLQNRDQSDIDADGSGDACDTDDDGDSVADYGDNCPRNANPNQADTDLDGMGDACDPVPVFPGPGKTDDKGTGGTGGGQGGQGNDGGDGKTGQDCKSKKAVLMKQIATLVRKVRRSRGRAKRSYQKKLKQKGRSLKTLSRSCR